MNNHKLLTKVILLVMMATCLLTLCSCADKQMPSADKDIGGAFTSVADGASSDTVAFGKKYYFLSNVGHTQNDYYLFNADGSAIYSHTNVENGKVIFQLVINFKWIYAGNGQFILVHNGTEIQKGSQDDAQGFCRVMYTTKEMMYWDLGSSATYFINEDFVDKIPNYNHLVNEK